MTQSPSVDVGKSDIGSRVSRSAGRIPRLKQAIAEERAKPNPRQEKISSLQTELDRRIAEMEAILSAAKGE